MSEVKTNPSQAQPAKAVPATPAKPPQAVTTPKPPKPPSVPKPQGMKGQFVVEIQTAEGLTVYVGLGAGWTVKNRQSAQVYKTYLGAKRWIEKQGYKSAKILDVAKNYEVVVPPVSPPPSPAAPKA